MPYIPHTQDDIAAMLNAIGADDIQHVFDEIPAALKNETLDKVEPAYSELAIKQHMQALAAKDANVLNFIGAGAYEHHIPSAVWQITTRGEIYTAYTPYQPEASQGSLQVIYEYQSMMCNLTGMDASNASLYDGASALAEAVLMAVRSNRKSKSSTILVPKSLNPSYTKVLNSLCIPQGINLHMLDFDSSTGQTDVAQLSALEGQDITAIIIPQVNYFGVLEDFDALTAWANQNAAVSISVCNPLQLSVLKAPGDWGDVGVDIATGEGQPLGVPLSSGGPYYGYMTCKQQYVRQMPGRIVGKTTDADGKEGYVLTLQAREQHIRRSKATSNICTNQGLVVTASTIHMSIMGAEGLAETVKQSVQRAQQLRAGLLDMGFTPAFSGLDLYEYTLILPDGVDAESFHQAMDKARISFGINLPKSYGIANSILLCATETKTEQHIEAALAAVKLAVEV